jgi:hypothetical protein
VVWGLSDRLESLGKRSWSRANAGGMPSRTQGRAAPLDSKRCKMPPGQQDLRRVVMCAAFFGRLGPPEVVEIGELPVPGPTDVLVEADVAVIDPVDTLIRSGRWRTDTPFPFVTGRDLVGTVRTAGPGTRFSPGDRVWSNSLGVAGRQGACSEYAVVPGERLYSLPGGVAAKAAANELPPPALPDGRFAGARLRAELRKSSREC